MSKARNDALAGMRKSELIKTIKALDRKQTQLLSRLAHYERSTPNPLETPSIAFPWGGTLPNAFEGGE